MKKANLIKNAYKDDFYTYLNLINRRLNKYQLLKKIISNIYDKIFILQEFFKKKLLTNEKIFNNIILINPNKLIYRQDFKKFDLRFRLKFIKPLFNFLPKNKIEYLNGDWDLKENLIKIKKYDLYSSFYKHFVERKPWKELEYYKRLLKETHKNSQYYCSEKDIDERFNNYDKLYENIKTYGYKSQEELIKLNGYFDEMGRFSKVRKREDEVSIAIGRNGRPIFLDGWHRLLIAQILNLKKIPVNVLTIHPDWLKKNLEIKVLK